MFSRLKLSVTWVPINNFSSDISLFLFNLYLQYSIMYILEFLYPCCTAGCCTTKRHNIEKGESYIPYTSQPLIHQNPPFHTRLPSQAVCSERLVAAAISNHGDVIKGKNASAAAAGILDLVFKESEAGGRCLPLLLWAVHNPRGRGLLSGPKTSQTWVGRQKRLGGLRLDVRSKTYPELIPMTNSNQIPPPLPPLKS